jgi:ABC-2 type transport system ATP-binding protein
VELEVWDGEALALVGPNGAGKSTLLSLLAGALEPSAGTIERRKGVRVGWAPQRPAQYGRLSARENLELFARLEGEPDPGAATGRLLAEFELPGEAAPSANLSVGNRQRLNLAISLLGSPDVLLLDEPTAALDPEQRRRLWARVAALRAGGGAVLFATQNIEEVELVAERVAALRDGRLVFAGSVGEYDRSRVETLSA